MSIIRVVQYGVGAMGSEMVRILALRADIVFVDAFDHDPDKIGRDLGEIAGLGRSLGVKIRSPQEGTAFSADVALHATTAFAGEAYPVLCNLLEAGINIVTLTQELFFPLGKNAEIARELDRLAKVNNRRLTATGINPGLIMDVLPSAYSMACTDVCSIYARRIVDFSPYGPDEMRHIGAGKTPSEFAAGVAVGEIGHIGLLETAAMVGRALGLELDELRQTKEAIISDRWRQTAFARIPPGTVSGFQQIVRGFSKGGERVKLEMRGLLDPDPLHETDLLGDYFHIIANPNIEVHTKRELSQKGGFATAAVATNTIPALLAAEPGFHTAASLRLPRRWSHRDTTIEHVVGR